MHRVIVISDLHLGGVAPCMMSHPAVLADFINGLPDGLKNGETLELVIAGDFIDFLAIPEYKSWTEDPLEACDKLRHTLSNFEPVFSALKSHIQLQHRLTLLIGNHDLELALPAVQSLLMKTIDASAHQCLWITDGCAYRIGNVLIEHGNRYDAANYNDWQALRRLRSVHSRHEEYGFHEPLTVSAGSEIVQHVVNPLKHKYPFIDLIQPQGKLTALLLLSFEPELKFNLNQIAHVLNGALKQFESSSHQPGESYTVSGVKADVTESEIEALFKSDYAALFTTTDTQQVAASDWWAMTFALKKQGLATRLKDNQRIPDKELNRIQRLMQSLLSDALFDSASADGVYGQAAQRLLNNNHEIEVVVMGHTHLARHHGPIDKATYINTGTWADLIKVPAEALEKTPRGYEHLQQFLVDLLHNKRREFYPTYADIRLNQAGAVDSAEMKEFKIQVS